MTRSEFGPFWGRLAVIGLSISVSAHLHSPMLLEAQSAGDYRVVAVDGGAAVSGRVVFNGEVPEAEKLLITKDEEVCGTGYRERHRVSLGDDGGLQGVVIFIEDVGEGKAWLAAGEGHVLVQKDCTFAPHLQVIPKGANLDIVNSDPVLHNIHTYEMIGRARRTLFNFGQAPDVGTITRALRPRRGNQIKLECDAHDFMEGWIYAAENPYYTVANDDGSFRIEDIPPGEYTVTAWHPSLGVQEQAVTLETGAASEITFDFTGN